MKRNWLKTIRIAVSLLFFLFTVLIFLNIKGIVTPGFINRVVFLQFAPSLIKFITLLSFAAFGFIIVLILTVLFGRIYCSTICPLGTLQDLIIYFRRRFFRRKKFRFLKAQQVVRICILLLTIIFILAGSTFLLNLLDPWSIFGKMMTNLFKPALIGLNNLMVYLLGDQTISFLTPVELKKVSIFSLSFALLFLCLVVIFSVVRGRQYCNLICPVGTLLGYLSKISLFKITLDQTLCNSCGACQVKCKGGCIDSRNRTMDVTRCIVCFDCLKTCPSDGVNYKFSFFKGSQIKIRRREDFIGASDTGEFIMARHRFFLTSCALVLGIFGHSYGRHPQRESDSDSTLVNEGINLSDPQAVDSHVQPVTPPGSVSQAHFVQVCTACHLCIATCPAQVIQPAIKDYGLTGIMQPKMDYHVSFCTYDCVLCTQICPTGAIMPLTIDEKKLIQIGKSRFIKKECIVYTKNTACGACSEHCPTKAVAMVPYQYGLTLPEVNNEICVGCGACEYACPTDPKAIVVDANPVHLIAKLPANIKIENKVDYKEDFPF